jgi:hypothetical protein
VLAVVLAALAICLLGACQQQGLKPFYVDAQLTEPYVPPARDETGGQDPAEIAAGAQLFENRYGSVLIPADWVIGKDRSGVDVKNLANGAVFRASESDKAERVSIKIYHNPVTTAGEFPGWFDAFYTAKRVYTLGPDYRFGDITYRSVSYDSLYGGTAYTLEYLSPDSVMVEIDIIQATPESADVAWILERVRLKEQ